MRTVDSEKFFTRFVGTLVKANVAKDAAFDEKHPHLPAGSPAGGEFAPKGEGQKEEGPKKEGRVKAEIFVAGHRNFHANSAVSKEMHEKDPEIKKLWGHSVGDIKDHLGHALMGTPMGEATIMSKNRAMGAWHETDEKTGTKIPVTEPSVHVTVDGHESEIKKRAAAIGREHKQQSVGMAIHDPAGEGRIFAIHFDPKLKDEHVEAAIQHYLDSGLGGATSHLDKNTLILLAQNPKEQEIVRKATEKLPKEYNATMKEAAARVRFIGEKEFDDIIAGKAAEADREGTTTVDLFFGGISPHYRKQLV